MRSQRFYAKHFSSVMSTEEKIDPEFFSGDSGPVRSFPSDKCVDSLLCNAMDLRASSASHYAHDANSLRTKFESLDRLAHRFPQSANQLTARDRHPHLEANGLTFFFQKSLRWFESQRR